MVELDQSCAGFVNASALCSIEKQVSRENVNAAAEIAGELRREREKNALLMERIALLEAQIQESSSNTKASPVDEHVWLKYKKENSVNAKQICLKKKFKRQKIEQNSHGSEDGTLKTSETASNTKNDREAVAPISDPQHHLVSWMSMDETQLFSSDETKDGHFNLITPRYDESDCCYDEDHCSEDDETKDDGNKCCGKMPQMVQSKVWCLK